jgi:hypothetical protein
VRLTSVYSKRDGVVRRDAGAAHVAAHLARERSGIAQGVERRREVTGQSELLRPRQLSPQRQRVNARRVVAARQRPALGPRL